jgi:hypothetical protein
MRLPAPHLDPLFRFFFVSLSATATAGTLSAQTIMSQPQVLVQYRAYSILRRVPRSPDLPTSHRRKSNTCLRKHQLEPRKVTRLTDLPCRLKPKVKVQIGALFVSQQLALDGRNQRENLQVTY